MRYKRSLVNDCFLIENINGETNRLHECFKSNVKSDNLGNTIEKIANLKEGALESDSNILSAQNNIQNEIEAVQREIEQEEAARIASIKASIAKAEANVQREIDQIEKNVGEGTGQVVDALKATADATVKALKARF